MSKLVIVTPVITNKSLIAVTLICCCIIVGFHELRICSWRRHVNVECDFVCVSNLLMCASWWCTSRGLLVTVIDADICVCVYVDVKRCVVLFVSEGIDFCVCLWMAVCMSVFVYVFMSVFSSLICFQWHCRLADRFGVCPVKTCFRNSAD